VALSLDPPLTQPAIHYAHQNIDDSEVLIQAMSYKFDAILEEVEELEIAGLEGSEVLGAHGSIKITRFDA
jgi:hypothetical protein